MLNVNVIVGNEKIVREDSLKSKGIKSCGCLQKEFIDLTGQKMGRLTVIERVGKPEHIKSKYDKFYRCICDCGNEKIINGNKLKNNYTQSCGCYALERIKETCKKYNEYDLTGDYGIGYTFKDEKFYFDLEDFECISQYCWRIDNNGYVATTINRKIKQLHRLIMDVLDNKDKVIDHINHVPYDNRKENLRICTQQQNSFNKGIRKTNTSGYIGIRYIEKIKKWHTRIKINYKEINLGYYTNIEDAIKIRKDAEIEYFGEFRYKGDD